MDINVFYSTFTNVFYFCRVFYVFNVFNFLSRFLHLWFTSNEDQIFQFRGDILVVPRAADVFVLILDYCFLPTPKHQATVDDSATDFVDVE